MEFHDSQFSIEKGLSQDDKRALAIMEESAELCGGHSEIALPWKVFPPDLPNNKIVAERRLGLLKKRLLKDPELHRSILYLWMTCLTKGMHRKSLKISERVHLHGICLITLSFIHKSPTRSGWSLTVLQNFYVDDCLRSVEDNQQASRLVNQLHQLLANGGFRLTKWISNAYDIIQSSQGEVSPN